MKKTKLLAALILFCILSPTGLFAADSRLAPDVTAISSFFQIKTQEIDTLQRDAATLKEQLIQREDILKPALETARNRLQMLEVMARMAKANPYDMRVALAEAKFMQAAMTKECEPLNALAKDLALKASTVQSMGEDLERKWAAELDKDLRQDVQSIRKNMQALTLELKNMQADLDKTQATANDIQGRIGGWITNFETTLPLIWKAEFLDAAKFRLLPPTGADILKDLQDWAGSLRAFFFSQYASVTRESGDWGGTLVLFWFPFMVVGFVSYRHLADVFENAHAGGKKTSAFGIFCLSLGLSLLAAFFSGMVKQTSLLLVATHILMLLGVQTLAWVFRNVRGVLTQRTLQPLLPLVFLSMLVPVLDILRLPQWMEHLAWVGLMVASSLFFGMIQPQLRYERLVRRMHPYILAILVAVAVLGWGNLAILTSTLWGVLALAGQLGIGATSVVRVIVEKLDKSGLRALVADLVMTFATILVWFAITLGVLTWVAVNLGSSTVFDKLSTLELNWGNFSFNFLKIGLVLLLFQIVRSLVMAWKTILTDDNLRWKDMDRGAAASLQRIGMYCLWMLFGLVSLNLLGISLTNFAVIAGGLSVGIGFGMQTIISNFISGLILLFDRAIQAGDVIEVGGTWATVKSVNIRNTEVQTFDNAKIFLPNSTLIANQVTNWTHRNDVRIRRDVTIGVAYGSDVGTVKRLLQEAATEHPAVLSKPEPWVIFNDFGPNSLEFILRFWVRHVDLAVSTSSEIREAIDSKFRENKIEIPFPQMDLHMRSGDGQVRIKGQLQENAEEQGANFSPARIKTLC